MCNFKAELAKCVVCFHFRFTSLKKDWKIMYIFSAKKKKSIRKVIQQRAAAKNSLKCCFRIFTLYFLFFSSLEMYSQVLKIVHCSATFALSLLPAHAPHVSIVAAMNWQLFWGCFLPICEPHAEGSLPWGLGAGAGLRPTSGSQCQMWSTLSARAFTLHFLGFKHSPKCSARPKGV